MEGTDTDKVKYYSIDEGAARRSKEMMSFFDYREGSATEEYRKQVDQAVQIAVAQKEKVDPVYHEKIDTLLDTYARKLAENMNHQFAIDARVPSILIAGGANFPVRKKEKQNAAGAKNREKWRQIQGILDKIRGTGTSGIRSDHPRALEQLKKKLEHLEQSQKLMKDVNAYYRKNKSLEGCTLLSAEQTEKIRASMEQLWHPEPKPFPSYVLSNNGAEIRRIRSRIQELERYAENEFRGWEFAGGRAVANQEENRLQLFFEEKPSAEQRHELRRSGFQWAPRTGAWQRLLNDNAISAAGRLPFLMPLSGKTVRQLQPGAGRTPGNRENSR